MTAKQSSFYNGLYLYKTVAGSYAIAFVLLLIVISAPVWLSQVEFRSNEPAVGDVTQKPWQHITIHRTFSDIDGREVAVPAVYVVENGKETRHDGEVIARELPSGEWLIKVGGREFRTRDKRESVTYFDPGPSPDNPGAIRS